MVTTEGEIAMNSKTNYGSRERHWLPIVAVVLILLSLIILVAVEEGYRNADDGIGNNSAVSTKVVFPEIPEEVLLCSQVAKQLYDYQINIKTAIQTDDPYRSFVVEYDSGNVAGAFFLGEKPDFSDAKEYEMPAFHKVIRINNLKTGTQYYYKVVIRGEERTGTFKTVESTRFISMPGVKNVRDIGGYRNQDGKMVRQGLLIRGTEIDGLRYKDYKIPEYALEDIQEMFGFVYDFDLREDELISDDYHTPWGENVAHTNYQAPQYEQVFREHDKERLRQMFADLADPTHYPMYLHCTWGKDRTGTIVFLLQGVLNMSEEDMIREYQLSGFVYDEIVEENAIQRLTDGLQQYPGNTMQEKVLTFLTEDVGVTQEQISAIRNIFLDEEL